MIKIIDKDCGRIFQGDIFKNVELIENADINEDGVVEISKILFPYVVVLTQDCDLEQDSNSRKRPLEERSSEDKHILSIIVAPLYNIEHVYMGEHLAELDLRMQKINPKEGKTENKILRNNKNPRYHYFEFSEDIEIVNSVLDFKHYFTVNRNYLTKIKSENCIGQVAELFREHLSNRFASYLSRIGLPN